MKSKLIFIVIFFSIIFLPSCKNQCQILEEKINQCKQEINCSESNDLICIEVNNAENLIKTINNIITEGTDDKIDIESTCSMSLSEINFGDCIDAQELQNGNWQRVKYLMSNFGIEGSIDKISLTFKFLTKTNLNTSVKCGKKILKEYESLEDYQKTMKFVMLKNFSLDIVPLIQTNLEDNSNIYIGDNYIKNENSPCDFNENNRFNIDYDDYDYIFCSKSSGWLAETDITKSNCALTRQEVFLLNWDNNHFINWCLDNYKNSSEHCKTEGNDYKCIEAAHEECYRLRENFFCNNSYKICIDNCSNLSLRNCNENCKSEYIDCKNDINQDNCKIKCQINNCASETSPDYFYECLEYTDKDNNQNSYSCCNCEINCKSKCNNPSSYDCKTCKNKCMTECLEDDLVNISCYGKHMSKIELCYYKKITENQEDNFKNCISDTETACNNDCEYNPCMNNCLEADCKDFKCFERSNHDNNFFNEKKCNEYSCYYNCQKKCNSMKIDEKNSQIMTVYREVNDEITGSNCDENEIFEDISYDYCIIEHDISNF